MRSDDQVAEDVPFIGTSFLYLTTIQQIRRKSSVPGRRWTGSMVRVSGETRRMHLRFSWAWNLAGRLMTFQTLDIGQQRDRNERPLKRASSQSLKFRLACIARPIGGQTSKPSHRLGRIKEAVVDARPTHDPQAMLMIQNVRRAARRLLDH
ncbi:hypothetical protein [Bradyrhizobium sp. NP1]|uniref:hypothetical protein n=1 Tax=Bradyrhizobium sp. NP1 TaxID=3049772 RepID=UPI0025A581CD|nr:hypothetical protein [Bradyrhizobium sp. NP1]WJR80874.1 hypothetical protein QOU61_14290 [Bradyrhizobium sp. NP1]